jgi:hypothetical protein
MMFKVLVVILVFAGLSGLRAHAQSSDPNPLGPDPSESLPSKPVKLTGGIQHSATLPPVPTQLRTGASVNVGQLRALTPNNQWFKVPQWFTGTWETRNHTTYYQQALETGFETFRLNNRFALGAETIGFQKDRKGAIWEFAYDRYVSIWQLRNGFQLDLINHHEPVEITDDKVVIMFRGHEVVVSGRSHKIQTYTPAGNGLIRVDASIKTFDQNGKATQLTKVLAFKRRTEPFKPWDKYKGRDMRKLFNEYLCTHGMTELCPVRTDK